MSDSESFAKMLSARLEAMAAEGSAVSQAALARELVRRAIPTTKQAVHDWCHGKSRPEPWKWSTLLDVLGIPFTDRDQWNRALTAMPASVAAKLRADGTVDTAAIGSAVEALLDGETVPSTG